jgi:broad specificity phosphatase PhoE
LSATPPPPAIAACLLPDSPTRLLLIRHAEVEVSYQRVFGGRIDMNLSPRGHEQAAALAGWLRHTRVDAAYASPMKRALQTLAPLVESGLPQPAVMTEFREVDFGDWTGLGWEAVHEKFGARASDWLDRLECNAVPNGEGGSAFRQRVEPALCRIIAEHPGRTVAIICHGGVICMILSVLSQLPLSKMSLFDVEYASVSQVALHRHRVEIELLNFTPWRDLK